VQQRLAGFADRNLVLVSGDRQLDRARLLLVRAGRLAEDVSLPVRATPSHLRHVLLRVFAGPTRTHVSRDELDDLLIMDAWLRRNHADVVEVGVDASKPEEAAAALREAIAQVAAPSRASA
jgi:hypothetical protein